MARLIGLSGFARCGKDTVGAMLVEEHSFARVAFADRMKEIGLAIDPIIDFVTGEQRPVRLTEIVEHLGWDRSKQNPEIRRFLQKIGTEAGRNLLGADVWVNLLFDTRTATDDWVITDVRFVNEARRVVAEGGFMVRINRPGVEAPNDHVSEHDLADWKFDYTIDNDGDLEDLHARVSVMVTDLAV